MILNQQQSTQKTRLSIVWDATRTLMFALLKIVYTTEIMLNVKIVIKRDIQQLKFQKEKKRTPVVSAIIVIK